MSWLAGLWRWRPQTPRAVVVYRLLTAAVLVLFCTFALGDATYGGVFAAGWFLAGVPQDLWRIRRERRGEPLAEDPRLV